MDKQREAFEAWAKEPPREFYLARHPDAAAWPRNYKDYHVECAWQAWKAAQQAQWLPIETAPKEELRDLIVFNGKVQHGEYWEGRWIDSCHDWMNPQPTHWMPLPPEPKE